MQIKYNDKLRPDEKKKINNFKSYLSHPKKIIHKPAQSIIQPETPQKGTQVHLHDVMTSTEVAEYLSISWMTLKRWTNAGKINCIRINSRGDRRYLREEIEKFMGGTK